MFTVVDAPPTRLTVETRRRLCSMDWPLIWMEKISGSELIPIKCQLVLSYAQASKSEREMEVGFRIQANHASSLRTLGLKWIFAQNV